MKVGVLADIHANRIALEGVLDDMPTVDTVVCAGDVVGYNPWPAECVEILRSRGVPTIRGNHDEAVVENDGFRFNEMARSGIEHARKRLSDDERAWLASLPTERQLFDGRVNVVHGHPDDPNRYTYPADWSPALLGREDILVLGHTHVQHVERFSNGTVVNPGSVGQPRDGDPRAAYAVADLEQGAVRLHRVSYDVSAVATAIRAAGLPERTATRLTEGQ